MTFGYLQTTFSFFQLFGGVAMGRICDVMGPRTALIVSQTSGTLGYGLMAAAGNVPTLFFAQVRRPARAHTHRRAPLTAARRRP